mgnify:CR=1 FL=1
MRKYHKRQILDLIATFKKANEEIRRLYLNGNKASVLQLLADMQNSVVKTGEFIERLEGEGTKTVTLMEEYCEDLYHVAEEIENIDAGFVKHLQRRLLEIENSIRTEFEADRLEVVFLPYKASMWDSLESIYLAAKEDPRCDVYCVPIPYYELTPYGELGQMHYEGAGYYDIEITNWQEYDIKVHQPDVVFIHYAYDDMVRNATVHPDFYSKKLHEYCEYLVYVPYFVAPDKFVEEYCAYLPGVLNADLVILQSEDIRQIYIRNYKKYDKAKNLNYYYGRPESKFIALGSPKYDKVINSSGSDHKLPADWEKLIYTENGEKKKVIFYNTHMFAWLNGGERYFKKLHTVFETFRNRNDVVLWWRPHPNTELNFRTLRPDLLGEYYKTVKDYKNGGWGIYDDTPDLHRAIACSDAYYGDGSSLTELFKAAGKPIYYQNIDFSGLLDNFRLHITNVFKSCGKFYALNYNGYLFRLEDNNFRYENIFPVSSDLQRDRNYYKPVEFGDKMVFIPHNERQIAVCKVEKREFCLYPLKLKDEYLVPVNGAERNFYDGIPYKNKIFLVPCAYRNIVAYNFDTNETEHCLDMRKIFPIGKIISQTFSWTWLDNRRILLASLYTNEVLEFNLDTYEYRVHKLGQEGQSFHYIFKYGASFFLVGRQPFMLKWDYETDEVTIFDKLPDDFKVLKKEDWVFIPGDIRPYKNKYILFGGFTNMILEFDLDNCEFRKLDVFDEIVNRKLKYGENDVYPFTTCNFMSENYLYFIHKNEVFYRYDIEKQTIEYICDIVPSFNEDDYNKVNNRFIDSMKKGQNAHVRMKADEINSFWDGKSGKRIYDYIKTKVLR